VVGLKVLEGRVARDGLGMSWGLVGDGQLKRAERAGLSICCKILEDPHIHRVSSVSE
jgi:hypothetical protein